MQFRKQHIFFLKSGKNFTPESNPYNSDTFARFSLAANWFLIKFMWNFNNFNSLHNFTKCYLNWVLRWSNADFTPFHIFRKSFLIWIIMNFSSTQSHENQEKTMQTSSISVKNLVVFPSKNNSFPLAINYTERIRA